jgi:hypothetical protein
MISGFTLTQEVSLFVNGSRENSSADIVKHFSVLVAIYEIAISSDLTLMHVVAG